MNKEFLAKRLIAIATARSGRKQSEILSTVNDPPTGKRCWFQHIPDELADLWDMLPVETKLAVYISVQAYPDFVDI